MHVVDYNYSYIDIHTEVWALTAKCKPRRQQMTACQNNDAQVSMQKHQAEQNTYVEKYLST